VRDEMNQHKDGTWMDRTKREPCSAVQSPILSHKFSSSMYRFVDRTTDSFPSLTVTNVTKLSGSEFLASAYEGKRSLELSVKTRQSQTVI
jgi:hypothetical protein